MNPASLSEPPGGETSGWMKSIAEKGNLGLCGSYIVKENSDFFNRWLFVTSSGEAWQYDKRHLFTMGGEDKLFTAGKERLNFTFRGVRISAYICYDLRFPVWSRNSEECDLMIYSANWPESRRNVWDILLKARAIENQCFVAGSNRTGTDGTGISYHGESMVIDPRGEIISNAGPQSDCSITTDIALTELSAFRQKFPVLNDKDDFTILI
jgi:predicted amidohydrolase